MFAKRKPLDLKRKIVSVPVKSPNSPKSPISSINRNAAVQKRKIESFRKSKPESRETERVKVDRRRRSRPSNLEPRFSDDSDEDDENEGEEEENSSKRRRRDENGRSESTRKLWLPNILPEADEEAPTVINGADILKKDKTTKYRPAFKGLDEDVTVKLQYPSAFSGESFRLSKPSNDSEGYDPVQDIVQSMLLIVENYLPRDLQDDYNDESTGFAQRFSRAVNKNDSAKAISVIDEWNDSVTRLRKAGTISKSVQTSDFVPFPLVERIINQTHSRTVSLNLKWLHQYETGTDNVYGELLPKFVSKILRETDLSPESVFVDLGSGVGNVVLQTALEAGCESWGCEMMEKYCDVATLQHEEFVARCRLWGIRLGDIHLERGDFLVNTRIHDTLKRADVILVNNQVFTPGLNESLKNLFLDLKDGCKIVSLKSFLPSDHKVSARNVNSTGNILRVEKREYFSKCVSWTDQGGKYFISTKDSSLAAQNF